MNKITPSSRGLQSDWYDPGHSPQWWRLFPASCRGHAAAWPLLCLFRFRVFSIPVVEHIWDAALFPGRAPTWPLPCWTLSAGMSKAQPVSFLCSYCGLVTTAMSQEWFTFLRLRYWLSFFRLSAVFFLLVVVALCCCLQDSDDCSSSDLHLWDRGCCSVRNLSLLQRERIGVWFQMLLPLLAFKKKSLFRYNLHTIKCTCFKCTSQWILVYLQSHVTSTTV